MMSLVLTLLIVCILYPLLDIYAQPVMGVLCQQSKFIIIEKSNRLTDRLIDRKDIYVDLTCLFMMVSFVTIPTCIVTALRNQYFYECVAETQR